MGLCWFHLFCSPGNAEDKAPHWLVELALRSHVKVGRNLHHNCSSQGGRGMKNASFSYLVSSEIMDINPMPRWKGWLSFFSFYPLHNFLAPISDLEVAFIYLGEGAGWTVADIFHYFNCSSFFPLIISLLLPLIPAKPVNPKIIPLAL